MTKTRVSLDDFLINGRLGPLGLGMRAEDVVQLIGAPECVASNRRKTDFTFKYGDLQLFFSSSSDRPPEQRLWLIGLYFLTDEPFQTTAALEFSGWMPHRRMQPEECEEHFCILGIHYFPDPLISRLFPHDQLTLIAGIGVSFTFGREDSGDWYLEKIGFAGPKEPSLLAIRDC